MTPADESNVVIVIPRDRDGPTPQLVDRLEHRRLVKTAIDVDHVTPQEPIDGELPVVGQLGEHDLVAALAQHDRWEERSIGRVGDGRFDDDADLHAWPRSRSSDDVRDRRASPPRPQRQAVPARQAPATGKIRPMADVQPLRALHYDLGVVGSLQSVVAPPYDVIDAEQRAALAARSPYNVVSIDLPAGRRSAATPTRRPRGCSTTGSARAPSSATRARRSGRCSRTTPAPTAGSSRAAASSRACAWRSTARARSARTSARTPAPRRTASGSRARRRPTSRRSSASTTTRPTPPGARSRRTHQPTRGAIATDADGTVNRSGASTTRPPSRAVKTALAPTELLIADGHHRYETARVYADEIGGEGEHRYVLMCLVALAGPGPDGLPHAPPAHRVKTPAASEALARGVCASTWTIDADRAVRARARRRRRRAAAAHGLPRRPPPAARSASTLKDQAIADAALADFPEPYRHLDTAVLEALILKGALGMTEDDISHLHGLGYSRTDDEALELVQSERVRLRVLPARDARRAGPRDRRRRRQHAAEVHVLLPEGARRACCSTRSRDPCHHRCHEGHRHAQPAASATPSGSASTT